ncbi:MAG: arginine--tRNA ligase [Acidobacteria bacterium]|nr:arginine--tRNA ligase [Acidobacteriota bacterium]
MFLVLALRVRDAVATHIRQRYATEVSVVIEQPRQPEFGELALPVCFSLAKTLKRAPRQIAEEMVAELPAIEGIAAFEVAGGGFINVRFERGAYGESLLKQAAVASASSPQKIIVEHTNINPNKAAHIGHLRNAVLGDTLVRMLRRLGNTVEVQNYIDNTGVQVADVVVAFHFLEKKTPAEVQALVNDPTLRFDYYCWDLYARMSQHYAAEPAAKEWRAETLHAIEADEGDLAETGRIVADAVVKKHLGTMLRLDVEYDLLPRESEILHLRFWESAFELLKERGAVVLETKGKNAGCWIMPAHLFQEPGKKATTPKEDLAEGEVGNPEAGNPEDQDKVIVRSNGTVTYVGKDIAYQLWKFGLIEKDFHYVPYREYPDGRVLWASAASGGDAAAPAFGGGSKVYNVIDVRQSYLQDVVRAGLQSLGFEQQARDSIHFSYEMVALTPRCCAELGIELSEEDRKRSFVEVSGRKGLGVKADDLIDMLITKALDEVRSRHAETPESAQREIATQIAIGALRYFMLRFTRTTVIAFDLQEALSFEGETGPYVQYAAVRARNILRTLDDRGETLPDFNKQLGPDAFEAQLAQEDFWQLLLEASRGEWAIDRALAAEEPAQIARYAFQLAQAFNTFYHQHHILNEPDARKKTFLLWMAQFFVRELTRVLDTMGIAAPKVM